MIAHNSGLLLGPLRLAPQSLEVERRPLRDNGAWLHVVRGRLSELFLSSMFEESQGEGNRLVLGPEITSHVLALTPPVNGGANG